MHSRRWTNWVGGDGKASGIKQQAGPSSSEWMIDISHTLADGARLGVLQARGEVWYQISRLERFVPDRRGDRTGLYHGNPSDTLTSCKHGRVAML